MQRENIRVLLQKALSLMTLLLGYLPAFGLIAALTMPEWAMASIQFPVLCFVLGMPHYVLPGKARPWYAAATVAVYVAAAYLLLPESGTVLRYAVPLPGVAILLLIPISCRRRVGEEWGTGLWAGGFFLGLFAQTIMRARGISQTPGVELLCDVQLVIYVVYLFMLFVTLNRLSMETGTTSAQQQNKAGISRTMARRNRVAVTLLFLAALALSMFNTLARWLKFAWEKFLAAVRFVISLLPEQIGSSPVGDGGEAADFSGAAEAVEKTPWGEFMDKVFLAVGYLAAIALAVLALYAVGRLLKKLFRWLMQKLRLYAVRSAEEYVDETESIFDAEEVGRALGEKIKTILQPAKKTRKPGWNSLDARGKIRYLYRCFWERHPRQQHLTAREALLSEDTISRSVTSRFADLYDKARYSDHPVSDADAEAMRKHLNY